MTGGDLIFDAAALEAFAAEALRRAGVGDEDATFGALCLVEADLRGVESHGVLRLPIYVRCLQRGVINARPRPRSVSGAGALEVMDGDAGLGYVVGRAAMLRAVELAGEHGIAAVGVTNSSHFGPAGIYARLATENDMIGIAMSNVMAKMVAPGGARPITGNNPLAVAIPSFGEFPFALDMSLSAATGGKLLLAAKKGQSIPLDWATDTEGEPTNDPEVAFKGFYQPLGGVKGLGLSFVVDILCGLVTGGPFGRQLESMYSSDEPTRTGHMMLAIDVLRIVPRKVMKERMAAFFADIKASPMRDPAAEMRVPGERAYRTELRRRAEGVPVAPGVVEELVELGRELGLVTALNPKGAAAE
jgi:L-2-hydroxycarboxylate dehydrogenase (NAD+)